jgi:hypothetical protein
MYASGACPSREACEASGECDDFELSPGPNSNTGVCVLPAEINPMGGFRDCSVWMRRNISITIVRIGCIARISPANCVAVHYHQSMI